MDQIKIAAANENGLRTQASEPVVGRVFGLVQSRFTLVIAVVVVIVI